MPMKKFQYSSHPIFLAFFFHLYIITIFLPTFVSCRCPDHQKSALLNLFSNRSALPSWTDDASSDCCHWEGITCDDVSSHVIGLDVTHRSISATLNSSTLGSLRSLHFLNLSYNDFNASVIPSNLDSLSNLTHLNVSYSNFVGQIPAAIARMANLVVLDLSSNYLKLEEPNAEMLLRNLSRLTKLHLDGIDVSSPVPLFLSNFTRLTSLSLSGCNLVGEISANIFGMHNLEILDVSWNSQLSGSFPNFPRENALRILDLSLSGFSGSLTDSFSNVSHLTQLHLRGCEFSGQIPPSLLNLTRLAVLDLHGNIFSGWIPPLDSSKSVGDYGSLQALEVLDLGWNSLHGIIPLYLFTLPSLKQLYLDSNQLEGELPVFRNASSTLEVIDLSGNKLLGQIPFYLFTLPSLKQLYLHINQLEGELPEINNASSTLEMINLSDNKLHGQIPFYLFTPPSLKLLYVDNNQLEGELPEYTNASSTLEMISLSDNKLHGQIPFYLFTLPSLKLLYLDRNQLEGELPEFSNASSTLEEINLSDNNLHGQIPISMFGFRRLQRLRLSNNLLNGSLDFAMLPRVSCLSVLDLSHNNLVVNANYMDTTPFPQLKSFYMTSCNKKEFPKFLRLQLEMERLDLSDNEIVGEIPSWVWSIGGRNWCYLNLSGNSLTSFQQPYNLSSNSSLMILDLHSNQLQGELPLPLGGLWYQDYSNNSFASSISSEFASRLAGTVYFSISSNNISGKIPPSFCNASFLQLLDLSNNGLSGSIPNCFSNLKNLFVLNIQNNHLTGIIPDFPGDPSCRLKALNLNGNQVEGNLPESLSGCRDLEVLDVGNNQLGGPFPFHHINVLSKLRVLILRSNNFSGSLFEFCNASAPLLQLVDLSSNCFLGTLPSHCFSRLKALMFEEDDQDASWQLQLIEHEAPGAYYREASRLHDIEYEKVSGVYYQDASRQLEVIGFEVSGVYHQVQVVVTTKGLQLELSKITTIFKYLDLSNNKLEGEIPKEIGALKFLRVLNLSQNFLEGQIPASIGNATQIESIDLSGNRLSGTIPLEMTGLTFLEVLNVSHNRLVGSIPRGRQFSTFNDNSSFVGNPGLCGEPLIRKCEQHSSNSSPSKEQGKDGSGSRPVNWLIISVQVGFTVGLGIVFGPLLLHRKWRMWYFKQVDMMLAYLLERWWYYYF